MTKVNLKELIERKRDAGAIEVETELGSFWIDPPELWTDEMLACATSDDNLGLCKLLLGGDAGYARFVEAGGSQAVIGIILAEVGGFPLPGSSPSAPPSPSTSTT